MKYLLTAVLCIISLSVHAQFSIDGRKVLYDSRTNTMLATVPRSTFNSSHRARITLDEGWSDLKINGTTVGQYYTFSSISGGKTYSLTIKNSEQYVITSKITFTFLPVLLLSGEFGYDYQEGTVSLITPDDTGTEALPGKLKWRGGSTNTADKHKRNYKIKLNDDHQFFGLRNDNKWILDAGQADLFRVRNRIATELWNDMSRKPYYADKEPDALSGVRGQMVEVFLNKEYRGIYCLTECMDRKQLKLKKFDKTTGEIHGGLWKSEGYGASMMYKYPATYDNKSETWDKFEVKYPELDDVEETDYSTLWNAINFVATSSDEEFCQHVAEYFDLPVVVDYYIFINVLNACDNVGKNMFWAVYDKAKDKRLTPAVWDLDLTTGSLMLNNYLPGTAGAYSYDYELSDFNLTERLKKLNAANFNEAVAQRYKELRETVLSTDNLIDRYSKYFNDMDLSGAAARETALWSEDSDIAGNELDFEYEIYYISYWLSRHMKHLDDNKFKPADIITVNMHNVYRQQQPDAPVYNINGQRLADRRQMKKGIYIVDGRKYVIGR